MQVIRWELYPALRGNHYAQSWLQVQAMLGLAPNTVHAYARGLHDYLAFVDRRERQSKKYTSHAAVTSETIVNSTAPPAWIEADRADIVAYIEDLTSRPNSRGDSVRYLHSGTGLANATIQQRLTVVRIFYDYLIDEGIRQNKRNPVGKGKYTPGRAFAGKRERGLLPHYERLPWIPDDEEWEMILAAVQEEPLRNRLMFLLAYDGALRRSELVALQVRDFAFPHQQITVRAEVTKNGRGRVVMYGGAARELLDRYLTERAQANIAGGLLFRSQSDRNRNSSLGITADSWDKVVARIAARAGLRHRLTTHTLRHLRLTDLARAGMDLHAIAQYAGHQSLETTRIYVKLSGRETAERVRLRMQDLDKRLATFLHEAPSSTPSCELLRVPGERDASTRTQIEMDVEIEKEAAR
ncbi:MAG: tyrosine-type recombinase/integrase [Chloroflexota bacterium]